MQSTIYTIKAIEDIPKYDRIKVATMNETAYQFIINILEGYQVGDKVVVIINDSLIPENERTLKLNSYQMLKEKYFNQAYGRIRTRIVKMGGMRSVGLVEKIDVVDDPKLQEVGTDLDSYFGIIKYEPDELEATPVKKRKVSRFQSWMFRHLPWLARLIYGSTDKGVLRKSFPFPDHLIERTDEKNAEDFTQFIDQWKDVPGWITVKMEGCSETVCRNEDDKSRILVCSRNYGYDPEEMKGKNDRVENYIDVVEKYRIKEILDKHFEETGHELIIQGELCGPSIQKNIYKYTENVLKIFRIKDLTDNRLYTIPEIQYFVDVWNHRGYNIEMVEVLGKFDKLSDFLTPDNIEEKVQWMERYSCFTPFDGINPVKFYWGTDSPKPDQKKYFLNEGVVIHLANGKSFKLKSLKYREWFG